MRSRSSSIAVDPHMPQADVLADSRGAGTGAVPPVSTLTTLNSLSTALPVRAVAAATAPARRRAGRRRGAEPDGQLEVVARGAHGRAHEVAVEVDLERLLDDELGRGVVAARSRPSAA